MCINISACLSLAHIFISIFLIVSVPQFKLKALGNVHRRLDVAEHEFFRVGLEQIAAVPCPLRVRDITQKLFISRVGEEDIEVLPPKSMNELIKNLE